MNNTCVSIEYLIEYAERIRFHEINGILYRLFYILWPSVLFIYLSKFIIDGCLLDDYYNRIVYF